MTGALRKLEWRLACKAAGSCLKSAGLAAATFLFLDAKVKGCGLPQVGRRLNGESAVG